MMSVMIMITMMIGVVVGADIVDQTCKKTFDYPLCLSLLRSDPRSSTASITGLALILVDKIKALGMETQVKINQTYKTKPNLKHALDECNQRYKRIVDEYVNTAITAITGDPKFAEGAIVEVGVEADICEGEFPKGQSPLTGLTQRMKKICDVTDVVVTNLL
ncbi:unnamed protein product [Cochlearia groenlandica]